MRPSLRALYIAEREGKEIIEDEYGFIEFLYTPENSELYMTDVYIIPERRGSHLATKYHDKLVMVARERGCKCVTGSYDTTTNGWKKTKAMLEDHGYVKKAIRDTLHIYEKEI